MLDSAESFALARSVEYFRIPRNVLTICLASQRTRGADHRECDAVRAGVEGFVTLEISNTTPLPRRFMRMRDCARCCSSSRTEDCEVSYKDKKGKYQAQIGIVPPRV